MRSVRSNWFLLFRGCCFKQTEDILMNKNAEIHERLRVQSLNHNFGIIGYFCPKYFVRIQLIGFVGTISAKSLKNCFEVIMKLFI